MRRLVLRTLFLLSVFFIHFKSSFSQNFISENTSDSASVKAAIELYHQYLSPETCLYDGSEYTYNTYYPFTINEGHPFFESKNFETGSVFYNNMLYEKVPLLYDVIHEELLIRDPSKINILRLNESKVKWFTIYGHTFIRVVKDSTSGSPLSTGYYDVLYQGNTSLYKKVSKLFKENSSSFQGLNKYVAENDEYFIKKGNDYFKIKSRKNLLSVFTDRKKEISQFMAKNKLKLRKNKEYALLKTVAYYDKLNTNLTKTNN